MVQLVAFLALAFAIIIAIFAVQNTTPVRVSFLFIEANSVATSVLVLVSAALGAALMLLLGIAREVRGRLRQRGLSQRLRQAEARIQELEGELATTRAQVAPAEAPTVETPTLPLPSPPPPTP